MRMRKRTEKRRIVVTGLGAIAPNGVGLEQFWANSIIGCSGVLPITSFSTDQFKSKIAGTVTNFDPLDYELSRDQIYRLDRYAQFAVAATKMAIDHAGLGMSTISKQRTGVSIANAISGTRYMEREFLRITGNGKSAISPKLASHLLYQSVNFNTPSSEVATSYRIEGPCCTMATGCTAGLDAIGFSCDLIQSGDVDIMITGGTEAPITPIAVAAFDVIGALSSKLNRTPTEASRPFDKDRDGFVLAEGCGILILEELNHARSRGARILAEISGFASTSNAYHMTDLPDSGDELALTIRRALRQADIEPEQIDYINAHGSSTPQNDTNETAAYKKVFGARAYEIPISSLKSMNGHPLAAANALESIATIMTLNTGFIHPTINYSVSDPMCDLDYVPNKCRRESVSTALKNASGFAGIHSALVYSSISEQDL
jgi:beta-ketoacyl-acyl-carrier-protein synthase II